MFSFLEFEFWLYKFFSFVFSNPIILIGFCLFFIFLVAFKGRLKFKSFKKNLFFSGCMLCYDRAGHGLDDILKSDEKIVLEEVESIGFQIAEREKIRSGVVAFSQR